MPDIIDVENDVVILDLTDCDDTIDLTEDADKEIRQWTVLIEKRTPVTSQTSETSRVATDKQARTKNLNRYEQFSESIVILPEREEIVSPEPPLKRRKIVHRRIISPIQGLDYCTDSILDLPIVQPDEDHRRTRTPSPTPGLSYDMTAMVDLSMAQSDEVDDDKKPIVDFPLQHQVEEDSVQLRAGLIKAGSDCESLFGDYDSVELEDVVSDDPDSACLDPILEKLIPLPLKDAQDGDDGDDVSPQNICPSEPRLPSYTDLALVTPFHDLARRFRQNRAPGKPSDGKVSVCDFLRSLSDISKRGLRKPLTLRDQRERLLPLRTELYPRELQCTMPPIHKSAGSINCIALFRGQIAVGSSADMGDEIDPEQETPYNHEGNLLTIDVPTQDPSQDLLSEISKGVVEIIPGHTNEFKVERKVEISRWGDEPDRRQFEIHQIEFTKHYTVNDVIYDPSGRYLMSTGCDKRLEIWCLNKDDEDYDPEEPVHTHSYDAAPCDIKFRPGTDVDNPTFALASRVVELHTGLWEPPSSLIIAPRHEQKYYKAGAFVWGREVSSPYLFASTEAVSLGSFKKTRTGYHKAFDADTNKSMFLLSGKHDEMMEDGDTMAITQCGSTLALFTAADARHILRLYDVRRKNYTPFKTIELEPFPIQIANDPKDDEDSEPEYDYGAAMCASFSQDGRKLAVGRTDNSVHIYDMMMLDRGVLYNFKHDDTLKVSPGQDSFGIVKAEWIESTRRRGVPARTGLLTGGADGCVRLWEMPPFTQIANGWKIAEVQSAVGYFAVGDRAKGEHELVVGDNDGRVYIYEGQSRPFIY